MGNWKRWVLGAVSLFCVHGFAARIYTASQGPLNFPQLSESCYRIDRDIVPMVESVWELAKEFGGPGFNMGLFGYNPPPYEAPYWDRYIDRGMEDAARVFPLALTKILLPAESLRWVQAQAESYQQLAQDSENYAELLKPVVVEMPMSYQRHLQDLERAREDRAKALETKKYLEAYVRHLSSEANRINAYGGSRAEVARWNDLAEQVAWQRQENERSLASLDDLILNLESSVQVQAQRWEREKALAEQRRAAQRQIQLEVMNERRLRLGERPLRSEDGVAAYHQESQRLLKILREISLLDSTSENYLGKLMEQRLKLVIKEGLTSERLASFGNVIRRSYNILNYVCEVPVSVP